MPVDPTEQSALKPAHKRVVGGGGPRESPFPRVPKAGRKPGRRQPRTGGQETAGDCADKGGLILSLPFSFQIQLSQTRTNKTMNEALGGGGGAYYGDDFLYGGGQGAARNREMEAKHRMVSARIKVVSRRVLFRG